MSFLLGFWLATLYVVGHNMRVPQSLVWADGLGALVAIVGGMVAPLVKPAVRVAWVVALSIGLFAVSLAAVLLHSKPWLPFCTLVGAAIYLAVAVAEWTWSPRNRGTMAPLDS